MFPDDERSRGAGPTDDLLPIELGPLEDEDIAALVRELVGAPPDGATTRTLAGDTGGLAGLLAPIVAAAFEVGSLTTAAGIARLRGPLPLPAAVAERVHARRNETGEGARHVLDSVCVGRELPARAAIDEFDIDDLAEVEQAGLIEVDEARDVVRPSAGVVGRTVRRALGTFGNIRLATELSRTFTSAPPERRVHWRLLAGERPDATDQYVISAACSFFDDEPGTFGYADFFFVMGEAVTPTDPPPPAPEPPAGDPGGDPGEPAGGAGPAAPAAGAATPPRFTG